MTKTFNRLFLQYGTSLEYEDDTQCYDLNTPDELFNTLWNKVNTYNEKLICTSHDQLTLCIDKMNVCTKCYKATNDFKAKGLNYLVLEIIQNKMHVGAFNCHSSIWDEYISQVKTLTVCGWKVVLEKCLYDNDEVCLIYTDIKENISDFSLVAAQLTKYIEETNSKNI
jgi:hypothetical protein